MKRAIRVGPAGQWPAAESQGTVTLGHDDRFRRRFKLTTDQGEDFLLDLPHAVTLTEGDGLALEGGGWIGVRAASESLLEITAPHSHPELLARLAWHLGNRHIPAAIEVGRILIREDHVLAEMLAGLGATLHRVEAPFTPERGAYDSGPPQEHGPADPHHGGHHHGGHHHDHDH